MYRKIPFTPAEKQIIGEHPGMFGTPSLPLLNTPVTSRMNFDALFDEKHPYWLPTIQEARAMHPAIYNNALGRGGAQNITDAFGIRWRFVPTVGGSIVEPGSPLLDDVNNWKEIIKIPDVDSWDWAGAAKEAQIDPRFPCYFSFVNGFWFERLISFMDFMYAAMALIDDEQTDALKELFDALTDLGCKLVDKVCEAWPMLDLIEVHDDWGAQKAPFFSDEVARELFVPYMRRFTDRIHAWGRHTMLHSCGHTEDRVECYIDAGFDLWAPQTMNDIDALYENYGDRMVFCVFPKETDIPNRSEEEQRKAAREFAEKFCKPGKPAILGMGASARVTPAFLDELYDCSRRIYLEQA